MSQEREALKLPEGRVVGHYRLHQLQTAWGFYLTYFADETTTGRQVLVHELLPEELVTRGADGTVQAKDERAKENFDWACERFLREGRGLASCSHPAVCPILEVFEANGTAYWVTPVNEGQSLKRWLEDLDRAPTETELRALLGPLLSALEKLHASGLHHLNLKLESIQVAADGKPVLVHFAGARQAIARHSHEAGAATTGYSPIEQYDPDKTEGPWTDIYSLGAVLYRAIYGRVPPEATQRVQSDPYQRLAGRVSGEYRGSFLRAIDAALSPAANARPQSIEGWRKMLNLSEPGAPATPPRKSLLVPVVATIAVVLVAIVAWAIFRPEPVPPYIDPNKKDILVDELKDKNKDEQDKNKADEEKRKQEEKRLAEEAKKAQEEKEEAARKAAAAAAAEKEAKEAAARAEEAAKAAKEQAEKEKAAQQAAEKAAAESVAEKKKVAEKEAAEAAAKATAAQGAAGKSAAEAAAAEVAAKQAGAARAAAEKVVAEKNLAEKAVGVQIAENVAAGKAAAAKAATEPAAAEKAAAEKRAAEQAAEKAKDDKAEAKQKVVEKAAAQIEAAKALAAALAAQKELAGKADPEKARDDKAAAEKAADEKAAQEKAVAEKAAAEKAAAEKAAQEMAAKKAAEEKAAAEKAAAQNPSTPPPSAAGGGGQVGSALGGIWETIEKDGSGAPVKKLLIYADTTYDLISGGKTDSGYVMAKLGIIQLQSVTTQTTTNSTFKYKSMRVIETDGALGKFQWERVSPNPPERPKKKAP